MGSIPSPDRAPIRVRLVAAYAAFLVLSFGIAGVFALTAIEGGMMRQVDLSLNLRAARVQQQIEVGWDGGLNRSNAMRALADVQREVSLTTPVIWVQILDTTGVLLASAPAVRPAQLPPTHALVVGALSGQEGYTNLAAGPDRVRVLTRPLVVAGQVVGVMIVAESLHALDDTYREVVSLLASAAVVAALMAIAGGWWMIGRALGPVATVTRAARNIAATGQFEQRITPPPARDELHALVVTFNDMLSCLTTTFQRQHEFLGNASHELRGPLTVIQGNLDLLRLDLSDVERQISVNAAASEVNRMIRVVSDLLFLAEVENDMIIRHECVALDEVVEENWRRAALMDGDAHLLVIARNDLVSVRGDRCHLDRVVANLLQNALRYTPNGGTVTLSLQNQGTVAELAVADTGIGISAEHLSRIFERFYRVDRTRLAETSSTGLGLAIVKEIVDAHDGQVNVWSVLGRGSTFRVILPTAAEHLRSSSPAIREPEKDQPTR